VTTSDGDDRKLSLRSVLAAFPMDVRERLKEEHVREFMEDINVALKLYSYNAMRKGKRSQRTHRPKTETVRRPRARAEVQANARLDMYLQHRKITADPQKRAEFIAQQVAAALRQTTAHRPADALRHGLIGDFFDAYMTLRDAVLDAHPSLGRTVEVRGFKHVANALLRAIGLRFRITDNDMVVLRKRRRRFARIEAELSERRE
jgi:hypothetical protein